MTSEQRKLAYELITNPPPGSGLAEAKEWGVDLTLLVENLDLTPAERAEAVSRGAVIFQIAEQNVPIKESCCWQASRSVCSPRIESARRIEEENNPRMNSSAFRYRNRSSS